MNKKITKPLHYLITSISLILILIIFLANNNHASAINPIKTNIFSDFQGEKVHYTFKVSDKLIGSGVMDLSLQKNKITGIATGLGMSCQCNVDLNTNIDGLINTSTGNINVTVCGTGKPRGIPIPGKITFNGPLKGALNSKSLTLSGEVNIEGRLATLGGFKNKEDILIEIQIDSLASIFKTNLLNKLASL